MRPEQAQAIGDLAKDRVRTTVEILQNIAGPLSAESTPPRQNHVEEFTQRALALTSDALEALENDRVSGAIELLSSADVFLEALQDLLVGGHGTRTQLDELGEARQELDQAKALLRIVARDG